MALGVLFSSLILLWEVIAWTLFASVYSLQCEACGRGYYPYNASCDAPKVMDCATDPKAAKPFMCLVLTVAEYETGKPTEKLFSSMCNYNNGSEPFCMFLKLNATVAVHGCNCGESLCRVPSKEIFDKAVEKGKKEIECEKSGKKNCNSAPSLLMNSTSWTTLFWTGMATAIIRLIKSLQ